MRKSRIQTMSRYAYLSIYCTPLHGLSEWEKKSNANIFVTQTISLSQYITMWFPLSNQKKCKCCKNFPWFWDMQSEMYILPYKHTHTQNTHIYTCPESLNHANTTMIWITFHPKMHSFEINSISDVWFSSSSFFSISNHIILDYILSLSLSPSIFLSISIYFFKSAFLLKALPSLCLCVGK